MSRLVAIDEVIRVAENTFPKEDVRKIMWVLCHTPTAYDVSKVVAELEYLQCVNPFLTTTEYEHKAIEIARKGGVE